MRAFWMVRRRHQVIDRSSRISMSATGSTGESPSFKSPSMASNSS